MTVEVLRHPGPDALADAVAAALVHRVAELQADGRVPRIVLTGGTIADVVHERIAASVASLDVDWWDVEFWFGDERYVDAWSRDRNAVQARRAFLEPLETDPTKVHEAPSADSGEPVQDAAADYALQLPEEPYDLVMLGVGPDGHCASLFPGRPELDAATRCVAVADAPKPPPVRISMTVPELSRTAEVWFLVSGRDKAGAVAKALAPDAEASDVPAAGPRGREKTVWWLDEAAASGL